MSQYTIEVVDAVGSLIEVQFTEVLTPGILDGQGPIEYAVQVEMSAQGGLHGSSLWGVHAEGRIWIGRVVPTEEEERARRSLQAIMRQCRREVSRMHLATPGHGPSLGEERVLRLRDIALFEAFNSQAPLDRIERQLEDYLIEFWELRNGLEDKLRDRPDRELMVDRLASAMEWDVAEPFIRALRGKNRSEPLQTVYERLDEFYGELRSFAESGPITESRIVETDGRLRRLTVLDNLCLQALESAKDASVPDGGSESGVWPPGNPVHLHTLTMEHLRSIDELEFSLTGPEEPERGQWLLLLGENGTGKTTILRAIALALEPRTSAGFHLNQLSRGAPLLRRDADDAAVQLTLGEEEIAAFGLEPGEPGAPPDTLSHHSKLAARPLVFGYGCRRGSALGGPTRESKPSPFEGADTLFNDNANLIHADTWLRDIRASESNGAGLAPRIEAILERVLDLRIDLDGDTTLVDLEGDLEGVGRVPLAGLSDGYLTTLGWVVDFLARWIRYARANHFPLDALFPEDRTREALLPAVVLIDEIDMHLHPRWQRRLVATLRETFPMTTFIVTSHNPLTLSGFHADEIVVLSLDEDGTTQAHKPGISPELKTGSELYDTFFGIDRYMPAELDDALSRYAILAGHPGRTDDEDRTMVELRDQLEKAGIRPMKPIDREVAG